MTTISLLRCGKKRWPRRGGDVAKGQKKHEPGGESRLMLQRKAERLLDGSNRAISFHLLLVGHTQNLVVVVDLDVAEF